MSAQESSNDVPDSSENPESQSSLQQVLLLINKFSVSQIFVLLIFLISFLPAHNPPLLSNHSSVYETEYEKALRLSKEQMNLRERIARRLLGSLFETKMKFEYDENNSLLEETKRYAKQLEDLVIQALHKELPSYFSDERIRQIYEKLLREKPWEKVADEINSEIDKREEEERQKIPSPPIELEDGYPCY